MASGAAWKWPTLKADIEYADQSCDDVVSKRKDNLTPSDVGYHVPHQATQLQRIRMFATDSPVAIASVRSAVDLGINDVPFPPNFVARYVAMDAGGCWHAFDTCPTYDAGEWTAQGGKWHELGIHGVEITSACARGLTPRDCLFEIDETPSNVIG
jgi:hypothetical protein